MRKITISAFVVGLVSFGAHAQNATPNGATTAPLQVEDGTQIMKTQKVVRHDAPEVPIWSETFSGGLPTGWTNQGFDVNITTPNTVSLWEYRGPSTTPSVTDGSRGAYSGVNSSPKTNSPIASPTAANGFMIFDSDYLETGGVVGGTGASVAPHAGVLTTGTINLTNNSCVELSFYQYYRKFAGTGAANGDPNTFVQFSTNGGLTWSALKTVNRDVWVNYSTTTDNMYKMNVSSYIGGAANAKIRFVFSGRFYFWMIDDIELNIAPDSEVQFTNTYAQAAPKYDQVNADTSQIGKYGFLPKYLPSDETRPYSFDANVLNYGCTALSNVKLTVDVLDQNNTLVTSFSSGTTATLGSQDTLDFTALNTASTPWPANTLGSYKWAYSITSATASVSDTIPFTVNKRIMGLDRGVWTNGFGSTNAKAVLARYEFKTKVEVDTVWVGLASTTAVGSTIELAICDNIAFTNTTNPPANVIGISSLHTVTQANITAGFVKLAVDEGPGTNRVVMMPGEYNFVASLNSQGATPRIMLLNDVSIRQASDRCWFYHNTANTWYTGFNGSNVTNSLSIRPILTNSYVGIEEEALNNSFSVSPNPASHEVNIVFSKLNGNYNIILTDMYGRVVAKEAANIYNGFRHTIDVSDFAAGIYMLNINNGRTSASQKIVVQ